MADIHELIDFVVNVFIVHDNKVLLIDHKKQKKWLPIGGHIELDEDPEQALVREVQEECGLKIEIFGEKPKIGSERFKFLYVPPYLDIHQINETHRHIAFEYFARSDSDKVKLSETEHNSIRWFTINDLDDKKYTIDEETKFIAKKALETIR